ncbi:lipase family protein [Paenibacillus pasadenensis]|uniref:lipase family protein n=1 Tax=Paenibacillus pasadenensis TaxID=217090 RepID=UPI00203AF869|nr:lipase family protein [Paenibacillus pasadenensis]MCM3748334.1 lipase family protein [Paenibacillus pasadenensis]
MSKKIKLSSANLTMDTPTALFLAAMCGQSYMLLNGTGQIRLPEDFNITGIIQSSASTGTAPEPFGFVAESPHSVVAAFRGTVSPSDWMTDFMADQTEFDLVKDGGFTHRGFTALYKSLRPQLMRLIEQTSARKPLFVTGHSLGAALATLASIDLAANVRGRAPIIYTFGSPRVGNGGFARTFGKYVPRSFRLANSQDLVAHLPPLIFKDPRTEVIYYYSHVSELYELDFNGGSVAGNHVLVGYFKALAAEDPEFALAMCRNPIGWCPHEQILPGQGS